MRGIAELMLWWSNPGDPQDGSDMYHSIPEVLCPPPKPDWPPLVMSGTPYLILLPGHVKATPGKKSPRFADGTRVEEWKVNRETAISCSALLKAARIPHELFPLLEGRDNMTLRFDMVNTRVANAIIKGYRPYVLSIHHNAASSRSWSLAHGVETFHHPKSIYGPWIAQQFQSDLVANTGRRDRGVKIANFQVLRQTNCPAILLEAEFFSNKTQARRMQQGTIQQQTAQVIASTSVRIYNHGIPDYAKGAEIKP